MKGIMRKMWCKAEGARLILGASLLFSQFLRIFPRSKTFMRTIIRHVLAFDRRDSNAFRRRP